MKYPFTNISDMGIFSDKDIVEGMMTGYLGISDYSERGLTPNGYDLRIAEISIRGDENKYTEGTVTIPPRTMFYVSTIERVRMPADACAQLWLRTTWIRKGIMGAFGKIDAGFEGTLTLGHNVQIGYFAQNQASLLDEELTVFQTIDDVAKGDIRNKIRDLLGAFMFGGEASAKKVKVLSGGERTRLALMKLLLEPVNLLILDEPTNHLDLKTKDILKQALQDFDGTLICVSHDRDFLDGLVTKVYEFGHGKVREHLCGVYEFLATKKMEELQELERK